MYNQITANKRRTVILIVIFIAVVLGLGFLYDYLYGYGRSGLLVAAFISFFMTIISYYSSDKLALAISGAKQIQKTDNPYLWRMVENLCISQGLPMPKLHIMEDMAINAFATGRDLKHASIAITSGALQRLKNEELEGVLAHELSHVKNYDIRVMTMVIVLVGMVTLLSDWMLRAHLWGGRRSSNRGMHPIVLLIGLILMVLAPIAAELIKLAVSRRREYLADASGVLMTRYPEGLANALEKIELENQPVARASEATAHLYIANPFGNTRKWLTRLFSTHPPLSDRIKILRETRYARGMGSTTKA